MLLHEFLEVVVEIFKDEVELLGGMDDIEEFHDIGVVDFLQ